MQNDVLPTPRERGADIAPGDARSAIDALAAKLTAQHERDEGQRRQLRGQRQAMSDGGGARERPLRRAPPQHLPPFVPDMGQCETHGPYPLNMRDEHGTVRYHADLCPGCRRQQSAERLLRRAAISPRFAGATFDNYIAATPLQRTAFDTCRRYAADFAKNRASGVCLIMRGQPGTGKNHLAAAIAKSVVAQGYSAVNATAHEIIRRVRDTWSRGAETEQDVIRDFASIDLLIIDEVGRQYKSRDGADSIELFNIIDARYRDVRPTIVISNLDRDGIHAYLGAAVFDRLREGDGLIAHFDWDSHRVAA